jgi:hypothetical protein
MSTSDGIDGDDWDRVHELALEVLGATTEQETAACKSEMLSYLDTLEEKYGVLPSILATRADYIDDLATKESLLLRASALAEQRSDIKNTLEVTHSLAQLYIDEGLNVVKGREQLGRLKQLLDKTSDSSLMEEHERLSDRIRRVT